MPRHEDATHLPKTRDRDCTDVGRSASAVVLRTPVGHCLRPTAIGCQNATAVLAKQVREELLRASRIRVSGRVLGFGLFQTRTRPLTQVSSPGIGFYYKRLTTNCKLLAEASLPSGEAVADGGGLVGGVVGGLDFAFDAAEAFVAFATATHDQHDHTDEQPHAHD